MADNVMIGRLVRIASRAQHEHDPIRRVELLSEVAQLVQGSLDLAVAEAKTAGHTWRALGSRLSVPYQTLYRRYGRAQHETRDGHDGRGHAGFLEAHTSG